MKAVFLYQLKRLFASVRTYLYLVLAIAAECAVFTVYNFNTGYLKPDTATAVLGTVLLAILPLVTAESFSGDCDMQRAFLALGASRKDCYLGRLLAVTTVAVAPLLLTLAAPLLISMMGAVNMLASYLTLLGLILCTLAVTAILTSVSVYCGSAVNSYLASYGTSAVLFTLQYLIGLLGGNGVFCSVLGLFSPTSTLSGFTDESFGFGALITLLLMVALACTVGYLLSDRESMTDGLIFKALAFRIAAMAAAFCLVLSAVFGAFPLNADITENGITKLSDGARSEIKKINTDMTLYLVTDSKAENVRMKTILENVAAENPKISVEILDTVEHKQTVLQYFSSVDEAAFGAVIVQSAKRTACIPYNEFYSFSDSAYEELLSKYAVAYASAQANSENLTLEQFVLILSGYDKVYLHDGYRYEEAIVEALAYCDSDNVKNAYVVGIKSVSDDLTRLAMRNMISLTPLTLTSKSIPSDCDTLIVNTEKDITENEREKMSAYLENGGKMMVLTDFTSTEYTELNKLCKEYGLSVSATELIIEDNNENRYEENPLLVYTAVTHSSLLNATQDRILFTMPTVINVDSTLPEGVSVETLISTSESSYVKNVQNITSEDDFNFDPENDTRSPRAVCVKATDQNGGTLILASSANIAATSYFREINEPSQAVLKAMLIDLTGASGATPTVADKAVVNIYGTASNMPMWICIGSFGFTALILAVLGFKRMMRE